MKKGQLVKSRISASPVNPFERMKRVYINQISRSDSTPQKIVENLYLGSVGAAYSLEVLKSLNISSILTVCDCLPPKFPDQFDYKIISVADEPSVRLNTHFKDATDYIRKSIQEGKNVLVHCFAGVSRSASIVIAYLMRFHKMDYNVAYNYVKSKRPWINPNYGFQGQLRRYCVMLKDQRAKGQDV